MIRWRDFGMEADRDVWRIVTFGNESTASNSGEMTPCRILIAKQFLYGQCFDL